MKKYLNNREVVIVKEFNFEKEDYCVYYFNNSWCDLEVCLKSRLQNEEDTLIYKEKKELEKIKKEKEKEIKDIQDKAIKSLEMRLRFNAFFGKDNKLSSVGLMVATELEKLIKEN
jgi:hypothetical protein